ncbi:MAG: ABC transporter ATP-binding protein [Coriobacteriia bacterium]|nr:ABC transporter ATP-binding protein [Coriobacteriia bacterium]
MATTIRLTNLSKTYPGQSSPAVAGVSLEIARGELVTLLGPSGCGKTTLLRLVAGFERPDDGTITFGDRAVAGAGAWIAPEKRGIGMVFQEHSLFPHLSVAGNVGFNMPARERAEQVTATLALVGLQGFANRMPHELSGGQQQRVALARALAKAPAVVLLDEPFSSLDADLRSQMRTEIGRILREAQATAVFVTHDQADALAISDRVVVMRDGSVEQEGAPRDIYQHPATRFVADFVGRSNTLQGVIGPTGDTILTPLGELPSHHTHGLPAGVSVAVSVRADSLELDEDGPFAGTVVETTYTGRNIDALVRIETADDVDLEVLIHAHPEHVIAPGDRVTFRVLPDFVAVMER